MKYLITLIIGVTLFFVYAKSRPSKCNIHKVTRSNYIQRAQDSLKAANVSKTYYCTFCMAPITKTQSECHTCGDQKTERQYRHSYAIADYLAIKAIPCPSCSVTIADESYVCYSCETEFDGSEFKAKKSDTFLELKEKIARSKQPIILACSFCEMEVKDVQRFCDYCYAKLDWDANIEYSFADFMQLKTKRCTACSEEICAMACLCHKCGNRK